MELSTYATRRMTLSPRVLLCMKCRAGGSTCQNACAADAVLDAVRANPDIHITLTTAFDEVGARTEQFSQLTPAERRRDLHILQLLGLCPGDTRTARDLMRLVDARIPNESPVCATPAGGAGIWAPCPDAGRGYYQKGASLIPPAQSHDCMVREKERSVAQMSAAAGFRVRAHHLLCMTCFAGRPNPDTPLLEDNLYELWERLTKEPDFPVTLIEGPGECCVCPPCHSFDPASGLCVAACHLRDRKKDLDTFAILGLAPEDTVTARDVLRLIRERIPHTAVVCAFDADNSPEWSSCNGARDGAYERGLARYPIEML